jgi:gliding motility-associated-like protein
MMQYDMKKIFLSLANIINGILISSDFIFIVFLLFFSVDGSGQKHCNNPPEVSLSAYSGSTTCGSFPVTVGGNTFGGSATLVRITTDGKGSLTPAFAYSSPFSFAYTPANSDLGKTITITVTTNNPMGSPCRSSEAKYLLTVGSGLQAPHIDSATQPTCTISTGSVALSGLPSDASWLITAYPGEMTMEGSGPSAVFDLLPPETYTFTVSISGGCISPPSEPVDINTQPVTPEPPLPGTITAPTCTTGSGAVLLENLPSSGTWIITRYPGTVKTSGNGSTFTLSELPAGTYNFTVTNYAGCVSELSINVAIPFPPSAPPPPVIGTVTQPTLDKPTGSVTLTGLPSTGTWTLICSPGELKTLGIGTSYTVTELEAGKYTFMVTDNSGCTSSSSEEVTISVPESPVLVITDPPAVCFPSAADLTAPEIKEGSTPGLNYTYWTDSEATIACDNPSSVPEGTYYIKGETVSGYFDIKPVIVTVIQPAVANAGPDQNLYLQFSTNLQAEIGMSETGIWRADSGYIQFSDVTDPRSAVSNLSSGENILSWIITNGVCPADTDRVSIYAGELVIPTLITPNGDSKNEYFVIKGIETLGRTELTVFDRRGLQIFKNNDYDNLWNGVDYNDKPLINDTYYFILRTENGRSYSGYIVIKK